MLNCAIICKNNLAICVSYLSMSLIVYGFPGDSRKYRRPFPRPGNRCMQLNAIARANRAWVFCGSTAPGRDFLIMRGRKIATKISQTWNTSHETILDISPLNEFLSRLIDVPCTNDIRQLSKQQRFNQRA